jgi:hypothetical protein
MTVQEGNESRFNHGQKKDFPVVYDIIHIVGLKISSPVIYFGELTAFKLWPR